MHVTVCIDTCHNVYLSADYYLLQGSSLRFFRQKIHGGAFYESKREFD